MAQGSDQPTQTINRPKNPEFQNSYEKLKNDLIKGLEGDISTLREKVSELNLTENQNPSLSEVIVDFEKIVVELELAHIDISEYVNKLTEHILNIYCCFKENGKVTGLESEIENANGAIKSINGELNKQVISQLETVEGKIEIKNEKQFNEFFNILKEDMAKLKNGVALKSDIERCISTNPDLLTQLADIYKSQAFTSPDDFFSFLIGLKATGDTGYFNSTKWKFQNYVNTKGERAEGVCSCRLNGHERIIFKVTGKSIIIYAKSHDGYKRYINGLK